MQAIPSLFATLPAVPVTSTSGPNAQQPLGRNVGTNDLIGEPAETEYTTTTDGFQVPKGVLLSELNAALINALLPAQQPSATGDIGADSGAPQLAIAEDELTLENIWAATPAYTALFPTPRAMLAALNLAILNRPPIIVISPTGVTSLPEGYSAMMGPFGPEIFPTPELATLAAIKEVADIADHRAKLTVAQKLWVERMQARWRARRKS